MYAVPAEAAPHLQGLTSQGAAVRQCVLQGLVDIYRLFANRSKFLSDELYALWIDTHIQHLKILRQCIAQK